MSYAPLVKCWDLFRESMWTVMDRRCKLGENCQSSPISEGSCSRDLIEDTNEEHMFIN